MTRLRHAQMAPELRQRHTPEGVALPAAKAGYNPKYAAAFSWKREPERM